MKKYVALWRKFLEDIGMTFQSNMVNDDYIFETVRNVLNPNKHSEQVKRNTISSHIENFERKRSKFQVHVKVEQVREVITNNDILEEYVVPTLTTTGYLAHYIHNFGESKKYKVYFEDIDLTSSIEQELERLDLKPVKANRYNWVVTSYGFIAYTRERAFVIYLSFKTDKVQNEEVQDLGQEFQYNKAPQNSEANENSPLESNKVAISPIDINLKYNEYIISTMIKCLDMIELKVIIILTKEVLRSEDSQNNVNDQGIDKSDTKAKSERHHMLIVWKIKDNSEEFSMSFKGDYHF